ncbi:hypothetical protein B0T18DRAFT_405653 [Schizothecium vesticola]|uniref:Uncharacterized protein n=1 Tax=Schizothecium vesticola TaxID=314040 RepID=A0AA40F0J3_9PEZI|nr:hypothetical protein B0T18DRAFT_405653 [Schizothecium vesticola]
MLAGLFTFVRVFTFLPPRRCDGSACRDSCAHKIASDSGEQSIHPKPAGRPCDLVPGTSTTPQLPRRRALGRTMTKQLLQIH